MYFDRDLDVVPTFYIVQNMGITGFISPREALGVRLNPLPVCLIPKELIYRGICPFEASRMANLTNRFISL